MPELSKSFSNANRTLTWPASVTKSVKAKSGELADRIANSDGAAMMSAKERKAAKKQRNNNERSAACREQAKKKKRRRRRRRRQKNSRCKILRSRTNSNCSS